MLSMSPTMYKVAFAGKYQRSWNFLILSASHFLICSSNPIGNLLLSLFSECRCCSNYIQKNNNVKKHNDNDNDINQQLINDFQNNKKKLWFTWQSTRYSIVFIICNSERIARRSFSTREERNFGWKAIYPHEKCIHTRDTKCHS